MGLLALAAMLVCCAPAASGRSLAHGRSLEYHGLRIAVPRGWPVFHLSSEPHVCVRFNRHAIYLGMPRAAQRCPARALGRADAILVEPLVAAGARAGDTAGPSLPGGAASAARVALPSRGLLVTATWARNSRVVERALGGRSLHPAPGRPAYRSAGAHAAAAAPRGARAAGLFAGLGFDVCSAPSTAAMTAWGYSPYRAIGIYIGGVNAACSQPNLTAAWVTQESAAGWHLIPTYVGLQAAGACSGCAAISSTQAAAQGTAAAQDAAGRAAAVGIGPGNPIYDDMEGYSRSSTNTTSVLTFVSAWTGELHALGYTSGVYSSGDSGIADLVAAQGTSYQLPDDIWIARWNGQQNTDDPAVPPLSWVNHQRLHQYQGAHNATYGGYTLNIDSNYLDGATAGATITATPCTAGIPDGTFVQISGLLGVYRIAGGAPLFVSDWSAVGGAQPVDVITQEEFDSLCPVPRNGTFLGTLGGSFYRVVGGAALPVTDWGPFGGAQPYVTIDAWDIANAANPEAHLAPRPAAGTLVEGLPSSTYWLFTNSYRTPVAATSRATAVNDAALAPFPVVQCKAPRLRHLTFPHAKKALRRAHCSLGKVGRPRHWPRRHRLRVWWQIPRPGSVHTVAWRVGIKMR